MSIIHFLKIDGILFADIDSVPNIVSAGHKQQIGINTAD